MLACLILLALTYVVPAHPPTEEIGHFQDRAAHAGPF
jgi:hypothetical protein